MATATSAVSRSGLRAERLPWRRGRHRLAVRRPFQLDGVALGIREVDRNAATLGAEAVPDVADGDTMVFQMSDDRVPVERLDAQAEVVHVAPFRSGRSAASLAQRAIHFDQIDERRAHAQVRHPELLAVRDVRGTEDVAIEAAHGIDVPD